jgi:hypothetical protein
LIVPETLTIDRGEAEVNSQGRGDKKLAIPEYTVYKYFIIQKNIRLKMIKNNKITHLLPVFCIINLNIVSWTLLCCFPSYS